jgi:chromosome segregation ATPase
MREKHAALYETIDTLEKDIKGHIKEIREREATISDKRLRIHELHKKNQELEKFKFVLDYKIAELKRQIAPRKTEMSALSAQIGEMERELRVYKKESADLKLEVSELVLKGDGMDLSIEKEAKLKEEISAQLAHVKTELHEVYLEIDQPKKLKDGIIRLYQRHVQNAQAVREAAQRAREKEEALAAAAAAHASATGADPSSLSHGPAASASGSPGVDDLHADYHRQRHYLERSIDSHNAKCKKDMRVHQKEHTRIMAENIALTKEVNELRREKYHILVQVS